jgi:hypothetical protein
LPEYTPAMDSPRSNRPPSFKKVLALVRRGARSNERTNARLAEFNRLYRFYSQLEDGGLQAVPANDERQQGDTLNTQTDLDRLIADELAQRNAQQQAIRNKYLDYPGYYALLASFYTAFIAPLEQDIAIAETCEELQLNSLEVGSRRQRTLIPVASFNRQTAQTQLAQITELFEAVGTTLSPAFTITDFMRDARSQTQDNY